MDPTAYSPLHTAVSYGAVLTLVLAIILCCPIAGISLFYSLLPLLFLLTLDAVDVLSVRRDYQAAPLYTNSKNASSENGRMKLQKLMPKRTGKRYLIVGTGSVGSRIISMLQQRGETHVYGMDLCASENVNIDHMILGNVTSLDDCKRAVEKCTPDVVYHTAAIIEPYCWRHTFQWRKVYDINVQGVLNMIKASEDVAKAFILTSSSIVVVAKHMYGTAIDADEDSEMYDSAEDAVSWYSRSKAMSERLAKEVSKHQYLGIIRPASAIFHHQDGLGFGRAFIDCSLPAAGNERSVVDFVYLDNVVLGHLLLEDKLFQGKCNRETFLISNDHEKMTSLTFVRRLNGLVGGGIGFSKLPFSTLVFILATITEIHWMLRLQPPGDLRLMSYTFLNYANMSFSMKIDKAKKMLGYEPAFTLDEGLLDTVEKYVEAFPESKLAAMMKKRA